MDRKEDFNRIAEKYYAAILRYSSARLQYDHFAAEECTQDVFMLLYNKINTLNLDENIQGWLYVVADRIVRNYIKKNRKRLEKESIPLDAIIEMPNVEPEDHSELFCNISPDEYNLLYLYYSSESSERLVLAQQLGISMAALYQRIHMIKKKLKGD